MTLWTPGLVKMLPMVGLFALYSVFNLVSRPPPAAPPPLLLFSPVASIPCQRLLLLITVTVSVGVGVGEGEG
jgi:hypothetical protein